MHKLFTLVSEPEIESLSSSQKDLGFYAGRGADVCPHFPWGVFCLDCRILWPPSASQIKWWRERVSKWTLVA